LTCQEGLEEQQAAAVALIARCQAVQGQPELEQVTWARLAQQFPASKSSSGALWQVARSQEQSGNAPEAVATYQQLIAQSSQEKEGWLLQARALKRAADLNARHGGDRQAVVSQYAAARELFKRALREAPEAPPVQDGTILLEMAQVQEALQQKQEAIATYVELLQQHPNTDSARQAEARLEELI
jgi:TolA-binding protein